MSMYDDIMKSGNSLTKGFRKGIVRSSRTAPKIVDGVFDTLDDSLLDLAEWNGKRRSTKFESFCKKIRKGKLSKAQVKEYFQGDKTLWNKFKSFKKDWEAKNPLPAPQSQQKNGSTT